MGKFTKNPLGLLDKLYGFIGGLRGVSEMDVESPITRVHDISRMVEMSSFTGGLQGQPLTAAKSPYFTVNVDHVHVGSSIINSVAAVYSNQSTGWALSTWVPLDGNLETAWVLDAWCNQSAAISFEAIIGMRMAPKAGAGAGAQPMKLIFSGVGQTAPLLSGFRMSTHEQGLPRLLNRPMPLLNKLLNNTAFEFISNSSAPGTFDFFVQCIRLPNGVFPPGMN